MNSKHKKVKYDLFLEKSRRNFSKIRAKIENQFQGRTPRKRSISDEKEKLLTKMDKKRWEKFIEQGIIVFHGKHKVTFS